MTRLEYFKKHSLATVVATLGTGLFPEVVLVQGAIESNNGASLLSRKYNNFFGIKAGSAWTGKTVNLQTGEVFSGKKVTVNAAFRVYGSYYASVRNLVKFLKTYDRYKYVLAAKDPEAQFRALGLSGYATAPDYANVMISTYRTYKTQIEKAVSIDKALVGMGIGGVIGAAVYFKSDLQKAASDLKNSLPY